MPQTMSKTKRRLRDEARIAARRVEVPTEAYRRLVRVTTDTAKPGYRTAYIAIRDLEHWFAGYIHR